MEDAWRTRLKEVIEADPRSLRAISRESGNGENYVQQLLKDNKDPSFPRLAKVLSTLGTKATLYVINGTVANESQQLRSALLAYGVDRQQLDLAIALIGNLTDEKAAEKQEHNQSHGLSALSNPHRESEPSR